MLENKVEEIWKDIYFKENGTVWDYRGRYKVSNLGRVKSLNYKQTGVARVLQGNKANKHGYLQVTLYKARKAKQVYIHRLVAYMFIYNDDIENKTIVNHINMDFTCNDSSNLEWCTYQHNNNWGSRNMKLSQSRMGYKHSEETKETMRLNSGMSRKCQYGDILFNSITELAEYLDIDYDKLYRAIYSKGCYNGINIILLDK